MRFSSSWCCCFAVGAAVVSASPLAMSIGPPEIAPTNGLLQLSAPQFFHVYTQQQAALDSAAKRPNGVVSRLSWAHDKLQLRGILDDYAAVQFNRRFTAVFDIVSREMPRENIFVRTVRTRQRIAAELARESELASTEIRAWSVGRDLDPAFLPSLEHSVKLYRTQLASFTAKPIEWVNQAAHKLH